jgi:aminoacrylate hydrolase
MPIANGLWYEWQGPEDGEVLILSPGLGGSAHYWAPNLAAFAERYRVLLYDHRGTGRSAPLKTGPTTVGEMAADVLGLMKALGVQQPHYLGHALGGLIGMEADLAGALAKLVVVNGWGALDPHTARCFDVRLALLRDSGPEAYVRAQPIFLYPAGWSSENSDRLETEARHQLAQLPPVATIERRIAAARTFDHWLDLTENALLIAADDDMLVPAHCSEILRGKAGEARLERMPWGGHACNVTDPEAFNRIVLAFLRS